MKLVSWNSQPGIARNWETIRGFNADVLTVQECEPDSKAFVESHAGWTCEWQVGLHHNGVAVLARDPYRIESVEQSGLCHLSTMIEGPGDAHLRFVGFWAMTPTGPEDGYPQQAKELIERLPRDVLPTVLAGDFNASSRNDQHVENVASLGARGLKSAYDDFYGAPDTYPGDHPTSYHQWNERLPHHMDYVFLPSDWSVEDVRVGTFAEYSATKRSDHMPLTVVTVPN
jgi:endonuclease/exonuclease/phosphatase family metal-dependent hydrolase